MTRTFRQTVAARSSTPTRRSWRTRYESVERQRRTPMFVLTLLPGRVSLRLAELLRWLRGYARHARQTTTLVPWTTVTSRDALIAFASAARGVDVEDTIVAMNLPSRRETGFPSPMHDAPLPCALLAEQIAAAAAAAATRTIVMEWVGCSADSSRHDRLLLDRVTDSTCAEVLMVFRPSSLVEGTRILMVVRHDARDDEDIDDALRVVRSLARGIDAPVHIVVFGAECEEAGGWAARLRPVTACTVRGVPAGVHAPLALRGIAKRGDFAVLVRCRDTRQRWPQEVDAMHARLKSAGVRGFVELVPRCDPTRVPQVVKE